MKIFFNKNYANYKFLLSISEGKSFALEFLKFWFRSDFFVFFIGTNAAIEDDQFDVVLVVRNAADVFLEFINFR